MPAHIQNLIDSVLGDGARAAKFEVDLIFTNSTLFPDPAHFKVLVKSTSFPGKSHERIDFKYKGRSIPIKGQTKYSQTWECTFYLTHDHGLKNAFEVWIEALDQKHNYHFDVTSIPNLEPTQMIHADSKYTSTAFLYQRNFEDDQNTATYMLENVFPTEVSNVQYSSDSVGQIQEFTVTFAYSHYSLFVHKSSTSGSFIDGLIGKGLSAVKGGLTKIVSNIQSGLAGLAKDAIGAGKNALSQLGSEISSAADKLMSKANELKQEVMGPGDMTDSIQNYFSGSKAKVVDVGITKEMIDAKVEEMKKTV